MTGDSRIRTLRTNQAARIAKLDERARVARDALGDAVRALSMRDFVDQYAFDAARAKSDQLKSTIEARTWTHEEQHPRFVLLSLPSCLLP